jgi:hypothetical protein
LLLESGLGGVYLQTGYNWLVVVLTVFARLMRREI